MMLKRAMFGNNVIEPQVHLSPLRGAMSTDLAPAAGTFCREALRLRPDWGRSDTATGYDDEEGPDKVE
jgi:hypothetical protein